MLVNNGRYHAGRGSQPLEAGFEYLDDDPVSLRIARKGRGKEIYNFSVIPARNCGSFDMVLDVRSLVLLNLKIRVSNQHFYTSGEGMVVNSSH